ncbi:MAG TPA: hypothetical protein VGI78_22855 [Acetobacteraceae bacterium]
MGDEPLRLNSEPVPADAMPLVTGEHGARVAAAVAWLDSQCGDYAPLRQQFIAAYLRCVAAQIQMHRAELAETLKPYDGLYAPEDFLWSALRPLPRGWVPVGDRYLPADIVFWDGTNTIALELAVRETEKQKALMAAGIAVYRVGLSAFDRLQEILPQPFKDFWREQRLPSSPFRRAIPRLV